MVEDHMTRGLYSGRRRKKISRRHVGDGYGDKNQEGKNCGDDYNPNHTLADVPNVHKEQNYDRRLAHGNCQRDDGVPVGSEINIGDTRRERGEKQKCNPHRHINLGAFNV